MGKRLAPAPTWPHPVLDVDGRAMATFLAILTAGLTVWEVAVRAQLVSALIPAPGTVLGETVAALRDPFYVRGTNSVGIGWHLLASLRRVLLGCGLAAGIAIPLGVLIGTSPMLARAVDPFVQVLRPVSPLAWLPIGLALLQNAQHTAIFVIVMAALWPTLLNTILGVRAVPMAYIALAHTLEASPLTIARRVLLPAALPSVLTGIRLSLGMGWLVIVAAEMLIGGRGIGYYIWNKWNNLDVAGIGVAILLIGLVGFILDRAVRQLERLVGYD
jgi:nitrate/nitrite transport system permease protein